MGLLTLDIEVETIGKKGLASRAAITHPKTEG